MDALGGQLHRVQVEQRLVAVRLVEGWHSTVAAGGRPICRAVACPPGSRGGGRWCARKGISGSRKGVEEEEARGGASATAEVPPVRMPAGAERGDGESAASTPRSRRSSREQAGTSSSAEDEGPISMRGMRLSLQASQANLLDRGAEAKAEDDEEWDDD